MDMREIEQLHAHYAQPALTIDISPANVLTGGAPLSLGGPAVAPTEPISRTFAEKWNRNPRVLWSVVFVVGAAAMFIFGSSLGKREARAQTNGAGPAVAVGAPAAVPAASEPAALTAAGHEWPTRSEMPESAPAARAEVPPASAVPADSARISLPKQEPAKVPASAVPSTRPISSAPMAPAPARPAAAAPPQATRSTAQQAAPTHDIKMF
ncbi:very large tegument protein (plasmid) [Cupriavidus sp. U2]|nr:very large tegument protein [Cupriavidus sp. U2]